MRVLSFGVGAVGWKFSTSKFSIVVHIISTFSGLYDLLLIVNVMRDTVPHLTKPVHLLRILQWWGKTTKGPIRAVASIYSWGGGGWGGGVGQKFPNDEKNFLIFHAGIRSHEGVCYPENGDAIYKHKYAYFTRRHITVACSAIGTSI